MVYSINLTHCIKLICDKRMSKFVKYIEHAKKLNMIDAVIISPQDIFFDVRAIMKCRWGCEDFFKNSIKCHTRNTSYQDRVEMISKYNTILFIHSHNVIEVSRAALGIERIAFLDGFYFAFAIRCCHLCKVCMVEQGKACPTPEKVRPCDQAFGIDMYKTAQNLKLPCNVLQSKNDIQNWYGIVLIE